MINTLINKTESMKSMYSTNKDLYQVNVTRVKNFEKELNKMKENLEYLTHYTIKGFTIESNFLLKIEILVHRVIGGEFKEHKHFPILIRSRKLELNNHSEYPQDPEFLQNAIQLPGANLQIPNNL